MEQLFEAVEIAAAQQPRDSFDPQWIVEEVGTEPEALFAWVRDNTYLVPYKGALRGPVGVLMDRRGNSLDRALLLRELLIRAGHNALLVTGTLTAEQAEGLLENRSQPPEGIDPAEARQAAMSAEEVVSAEEVWAGHGLDVDMLRDRITEQEAAGDEIERTLAARTDEQTRFLVDLAGDLISGQQDERALRIESLRDHWWVEIQMPTNIVDLDPSLPDAEVGEIIAQPATRFSPESVGQLRGLPDMTHTVTIRVIIERLNEGELEEQVALEHEIFPAELYGKPVQLLHTPPSLPQELSTLTGAALEERLATLEVEREEWLPILRVGDEEIVQKSFTKTGELNSDPGSSAASAGQVGNAVGGMFGGFGGALGGAAPEQTSYLTAEFIEYELHVPGAGTRKIRREVFDLIGAAARLGDDFVAIQERLAAREEPPFVVSEVDILATPTLPSASFYAHLAASALAANREVLLGSLEGDFDGNPASVDTAPFPSPAYGVALALREMASGAGFYSDRVSIFTFHRLGTLSGEELTEIEAFDVVTDGSDAGSASADADDRLRRGVMLTNIEAAAHPSAEAGVVNTALLLEAGREQGVDWIALRSPTDPGWQELKLSPDSIARIRESVEAGAVVVAPLSPISVAGQAPEEGWWTIDPLNGATLGIGANGWGQGMVEQAEPLVKVAISTYCFISAGLKARSSTAVRTSARLLVCAAGLGLRTAGFISNSKGIGMAGDIISLVASIGDDLADNLYGDDKK
ncbi:MAG TPA: hypothetical protein VF168_14240 [Trueperaceae bacterium]